MKKIIAAAVVLVLTMGLQESKAQIKAGGGLVFGTGAFDGSTIDNDLGIKVDGKYKINEKFSAGADLTFFFPKEESGVTARLFAINLNAFYEIYAKDEITIYGIGGINIASVKVEFENSFFGNASSSSSETGLNLGAGIDYQVNFGEIFGDLKLAGLGGNADQLVLGAGVRIPFGE